MFTAYDDETLLGLGLLVHLGDPSFKPTLERIEAEPAILGRISVDPLRGVAIGVADGSRTFSISRPSSVISRRPPTEPASQHPDRPKTPTADGDDAEGSCVIASADELAGVGEQRAFFEAECVDVAEMISSIFAFASPRSASTLLDRAT